MDPTWRNYLVVNAVDWLVLSIIGWLAVRWAEVAVWIPIAVVAAWIVKDLLLYPRARRYYESDPAERRLVGDEGEALTGIDPRGFARVHGEIWQAHVRRGSAPVAKGQRVRVCDVEGLHLLVEPSPPRHHGRAGPKA